VKSEEVSIRSVLAEMNRKLDRVLAVVDKPTKPAYTYSQEQVVANLALACEMKGLPKRCALSLRTIQRMEKRQARPRAGYSAAVRLSQVTLISWLHAYVQEELAKLSPVHAISYNENLLSHQSPLK